jgi:hypothetical protein
LSETPPFEIGSQGKEPVADLLIFADTREHLNILVEGFVQYMEYAHINFNPKKCKILIHNAEKILIPPLFLPDANNLEQEVEVCNIKDSREK